MAYLNLLYHLKLLRNLSVDYLKLICHLFESTILIIVYWFYVSGYANNPVYTINLIMYLYHLFYFSMHLLLFLNV